MKPIKILVTGADAQVTELSTLTCGTVGQGVAFTFEGWEGLQKTAVFRCGKVSLPVVCREDTAIIPWQVLEAPGCHLYVGVYGTDGQGKILPTVWACAGKVEPGATLPEDTPKEPATDVYGQILAVANSVRADADAGKFTPKKGVDYWTEGEKDAIVQAVLSALPVYNGEVEAV